MNGPQHYCEAERLAQLVTPHMRAAEAHVMAALAQVHATLALAAATALNLDSVSDQDAFGGDEAAVDA
jgi:hypothetical protein